MKWIIALTCSAIVLEVALNDPMRLRDMQFGDLCRAVTSYAQSLTHSDPPPAPVQRIPRH